jgi:hypothetical protein
LTAGNGAIPAPASKTPEVDVLIPRGRIAFVLALLFLPLSRATAQVDSVQVRVPAANIRASAGTEHAIIAVLHQGDVRPIHDDVPYWFEIVLIDGRHGFIAKSLTTVIVDTVEVEHFEDELAEPLDEMYEIPPHRPTVTLPGCTPSTIPANFAAVCSVEGSGGLNALANVANNRVTVPCAFEIMTGDDVLDLNSLPKNVRTLDQNDPRLQYLEDLEARPLRLDGFLSMVKRSEKESTNCDDPDRRDTHMDVIDTDVGDPKDRRNKIVYAEIAPWFSEAHTNWIHTQLWQHAKYRGRYNDSVENDHPSAAVKIYGWLFFDNWHGGDGTIGTSRGTAWEVHPITRIEVLLNGTWTAIN